LPEGHQYAGSRLKLLNRTGKHLLCNPIGKHTKFSHYGFATKDVASGRDKCRDPSLKKYTSRFTHLYLQRRRHYALICYNYYYFTDKAEICSVGLKSRALGAALLSLPVIVARAYFFVSKRSRGNTQTCCAALFAEKQAWLSVRSCRTTIGTS